MRLKSSIHRSLDYYMKSITRLLFIFLFYFSSTAVQAQQEIHNDLNLKYLISNPVAKSAGSPLIILLHGFGSNEADLFELKDAFPKNFIVVSARAPMNIGPNAYQWFGNKTINGVTQGDEGDLKRSRNMIKIFITEIKKKYHANPSEVYLCGFSQGAMMSYEVGLTSPELLKGIAPLSGKIFDSLKPDIKKSASLNHLKIFIGHGDADNRVELSAAVIADAYLKKLGLAPSFHIYKGMNHAISDQEIKDLTSWLLLK